MYNRRLISGCTMLLVAIAGVAYFAAPSRPLAQEREAPPGPGLKVTVVPVKSNRIDFCLTNIGPDMVKVSASFVERGGTPARTDVFDVIKPDGNSHSGAHEVTLGANQTGRILLNTTGNLVGFVELRPDKPRRTIGHAVSTVPHNVDTMDWHFILNSGLPF